MILLSKFVRLTFISISKIFLSIFFGKKYLRGKWFDNSYRGWMWSWKALLHQKIFRNNANVNFPVSVFNTVYNQEKIFFNIDDINNFQGKGKYFQNMHANIVIGKGTYIANNVGIITSNHDLNDLDSHSKGKDVIIGDHCWIGINSVLLPGVKLGNRTIIGAGSVVTKSFPEGNQIVAGNPARIIKKLEVI